MTDQEKMVELLDSFKVGYEILNVNRSGKGKEILIDGGYPGFYTMIEFSKDGKFQDWGCYE